MIITIDGPSGTGKSTVAKRVAECLHFFYFDTGAMYRIVTWFFLQNHVDLKDAESVDRLLKEISFKTHLVGTQPRYFIDDVDVTEEIRSAEVTAAVSAVSALAPVRAILSEKQRALALQGDAVFEGRDMGSAVFPKAEIKIFLTARPEIRAQRRRDEMLVKQSKNTLTQQEVQEDLVRRDAFDSSREIAPLCIPQGAHVIDTSDLSIDEVVDSILKYKGFCAQSLD